MDMQDALRTLHQSFLTDPGSGKANSIIRHMVADTLRRLESGQSEPVQFVRDNFVAACHPDGNPQLIDTNKWVPRTKDLRAALSARTHLLPPGYALVLRDVTGGGKGNISQFWLALEEHAPDTDEVCETLTAPLDITYRRTEKGEVKPARWLRWWLRHGEVRNRSGRGKFFLGSILLLSAGWVVMYVLSIVGMWLSNAPLTLGHVVKLLVTTAAFWFGWREIYRPWWQLLDERVVSAPNLVVAFTEDPCQLEMYRHAGEKWIRLVRFTADCPLCGGSVELMSGKPDHRVPLVGRCLESPHYHVFSFDRSHLLGTYIGPPLPAALKSPANADTQRIEAREPAIAN
jgi:hypothetical protein